MASVKDDFTIHTFPFSHNVDSKSLEFINESPPIDEELSKEFQEKLDEYEKEQREKAKQEARYQQKYGRKKRQIKAENRHRLVYTLGLFNIAYIKVDSSRQTIASIAGVHRNTFDNHKRELKAMGYLDWKSGKKTYETNTYFLPEHVSNQHLLRPKDFSIPWWLWDKIEKILKKLNWNDQQIFYLQFVKDLVHHILFENGSLRTSLDENEKKSSKDPPKTRAGPKKTILWQLLKPFDLPFKEKVILSSYGEGPLRAAISDLQSYSGKVKNVVAFLISRCKTVKAKFEDMAKEVYASAEENVQWLKKYLSKDFIKKKCHFYNNPDEIDRSTKSKKPYVRFLTHKTDAEKSKLIIEQKVNGHWTDKTIELTREKFRTAVMETFEMAFKQNYADFS